MTRLAPVGLCLLVVLAGCVGAPFGGLTADGTTTEGAATTAPDSEGADASTTASDATTTTGESDGVDPTTAVNASRVFERVEALLGVTARTSDRWTPTRGEAGATRCGELWTYAAPTASLDADRADAAATGWGNDVLVRYDWAYDPGWAWVTR